MALPKQHLCGQTFHSIRRTQQGIYYLTPQAKFVDALAYTFGLGIQASRLIPHVDVSMSNHRHGVHTDLNGCRAKFHEIHHGTYGSQILGFLRVEGPLWDLRGPTEPVILPGPSEAFFFVHEETPAEQVLWRSRWDELGLDHIDRTIMYDLMNPVSANLVENLSSFPGFKVTPEDWGRWCVHTRPYWFADAYPEASAFMALPPPRWWDRAETIDCGDTRVVVAPELLNAFEERRRWARKNRPSGTDCYDPEAFELFVSRENLEAAKAYYKDLTDTLEEQFRVRRAARGRHVLGRAALKKQPWDYKPPKSKTPITKGNARYKPRFTGDTKDVARANKAYGVFCKNYRRAGGRFASRRDFSIEFPAGTVRMRLVVNVRCRGAPLPDENPMLPPPEFR